MDPVMAARQKEWKENVWWGIHLWGLHRLPKIYVKPCLESGLIKTIFKLEKRIHDWYKSS